MTENEEFPKEMPPGSVRCPLDGRNSFNNENHDNSSANKQISILPQNENIVSNFGDVITVHMSNSWSAGPPIPPFFDVIRKQIT